MLLNLVPANTSLKFMSLRKVSAAFSIILMVASLGLFFTKGLNLGIDFKGGSFVEIRTTDGPADIVAIREKTSNLGLGDVQIQAFGTDADVLIRIEEQDGGETAQRDAIVKLRAALGENIEYRRLEVVGPTVSGELAQAGTIAVIVALIGVMIYIWLRFEWEFAIGSLGALVHDVILTLGMFSLTQLEFNLSSIAAILTIVGYSLNDTVVVFDRIRETLRRYKKKKLIDIIDMALNQTLSRTILTSVTTLLALITLYIGVESISSLVIAMIWGVIVGTYSSIFTASPILIALGLRPETFEQPIDADK